jgi:hypothetical protein
VPRLKHEAVPTGVLVGSNRIIGTHESRINRFRAEALKIMTVRLESDFSGGETAAVGADVSLGKSPGRG